MLIFKIVLLESSEVETDYLMTDGRKIVQTDGNNLLNIGMVRYLSNKKRIFKIGLLEPSEVETDPLKTDGQKNAQTDTVLNIGTWCHTFPTKKEF